MPVLELTDQEVQQLVTILATTKEHPWTVTNPLLMKITSQAQQQQIATRELQAAHAARGDGKDINLGEP